MQDQNSVILMYHQAEGIKHSSDVNQLNAPKDIREKAIDICDDITKMTKKYTVRLWCCILMPIGMVVMIISGLFVPSPTKYILILLGLGILVIFPILVFVFKAKKKKKINELIEKFAKKTNGIITATANHEVRTSYSKSGTRTFTVIGSITLRVKDGLNYNSQSINMDHKNGNNIYNPQANTGLPMSNTNNTLEYGPPGFNPNMEMGNDGHYNVPVNNPDMGNNGHYSQPVNIPTNPGTNHYGYYSDVHNQMNNGNANNMNPANYPNNPYNNNNNPNLPQY